MVVTVSVQWRFGLLVPALVALTKLTSSLVNTETDDRSRVYRLGICNQMLKPTQLLPLCGMGNEYQPTGSGIAVWLGR